jgi:cysteine desulfurase/selenocysteine lyase
MIASEVPDAPLPPGLPDPATLARLANQFFQAFPADQSHASAAAPPSPRTPTNLQPAGLTLPPGAVGPAVPGAVPVDLPPGHNLAPTSVQAVSDLGAASPKLLPKAAAANGIPDHALVAAPGYDGRLGSQLLGVPQVYAADVPGKALASRAPLGVGEYYFIDTQPAHALAGKDATSSKTATPPIGQAAGFYFSDYSAYSAVEVPSGSEGSRVPFNVNAVRADFPILQERVNGRPLVWFDNAATTQKPQSVIDRIAHFYAHENSNIHRGAHELAARATDAYEKAREIVRRFIGASSVEEIVFVRGTTEAINLVAKSWGVQNVAEGDEIVISHLEHHANIVPWQQLASEKGAKLRVIPVDDSGQVILSEYQKLLNDRTKIVSVTQVSNALGTVVPVADIVDIAQRRGIRTLVDGAQSVSHLRVDVRQSGTDFFVFSGHKIFGPTGIGVLYGKRDVLASMPPWQGGGNMIVDVTFDKTIFHEPPSRFEAGTGNIADAVGLGAALEYVERLGIETVAAYEHGLLEYATAHMTSVPGLRMIGTASEKASVLSFVLDGYTTDQVGQALNQEGIAVRTGHHCAQPILRRFGLEATVRPSLAFYNTCEEVDRMVAVLRHLTRR